jgi:ribosomal protein S20
MYKIYLIITFYTVNSLLGSHQHDHLELQTVRSQNTNLEIQVADLQQRLASLESQIPAIITAHNNGILHLQKLQRSHARVCNDINELRSGHNHLASQVSNHEAKLNKIREAQQEITTLCDKLIRIINLLNHKC